MTLKATNETIRVVTSDAVTIDYHVNYADLTASAATDSTTEGSITTATTTTIVSSPSSDTQRLITYASFVNKHASLSQTLYLTKEISGSPTTLTPLCVLAYGEMLVFIKGEGWSKLNRNGDLILVGATGATGASGGGITTFVEIDDDFILENGNGYVISDSSLTANITVDTDSLVAGDECEVYNANLTYSVSFIGATVYGFGGGSAQDSIIGASSVKIKHIGTKIIMI